TGETVVKNPINSYATVNKHGADTVESSRLVRPEVHKKLLEVAIGESPKKILELISEKEGGFETVNMYDIKRVTWGFVQWAGGSESDLTKALAIIKAEFPKEFSERFEQYGIDVQNDKLVVKPAAGGNIIRGTAAAKAIQAN